jgi:hypothetical protein
MDHYYQNENITLYLSDEIDSEKHDSILKVEYSKPIKLQQKMELALAQICCPTLKYFPTDDEYYVDFYLHFIKPKDIECLKEKLIHLIKDTYHQRFFMLPHSPPVLAKNEISNDEVYEVFKRWEDQFNKLIKIQVNSRFDNVKLNQDNPADETISVKIDQNSNIESKLKFNKLMIFRKEVDQNVKPHKTRLILNNRPAFIEIIKAGSSQKDLLLVAYVVFSKRLHLTLKLDEDRHPMNIFYEKEISNRDSFHKHISQSIISEHLEKRLEIGIPVEIVYVYCNIIIDSYMNNQKVNVLQMFSPRYQTEEKFFSIDFKNLIYIPVRYDEIHSITIEIRDRFGNILHYDSGGISAVLKLRPIEHI